MLTKDTSTCLKQVANYLNFQPCKINFAEDGMCYITRNNESIKGVLNIMKEYLKESKSDIIGGTTHADRPIVRQWIEFATVYLLTTSDNNNIKPTFHMLNEAFKERTFLAGNQLTLSDIFMYYILHSKMENLSYLEKEKYIHVCRWFDNLQQNPRIRQSNKEINFNTVHLADLVPARH